MMVHTLTFLEEPPYASGCFVCNLCWEKGCGPVYHCSECKFDIHLKCAAKEKEQTHFSHHQHLLYLCLCSSNHTCDGCGENIQNFAFRCESCDYDMHSLCVRAPKFIVHPSHLHALVLTKSSDIPAVCDFCSKVTSDLYYQCYSCKYNLHQFCARIPSQCKHSRHEHMLKLGKAPNEDLAYVCAVCGHKGRAWCFGCTECRFYVHLHCTGIVHELPHANAEVSVHEDRSISTALLTPSSSALGNVSCVPTVSRQDLEAVEKVLRFAEEMLKVSAAPAAGIDEQDICPTCLEGYGPTNPKRITSCGHNFHLRCILKWMERCTSCPICRKNVSIRM